MSRASSTGSGSTRPSSSTTPCPPRLRTPVVAVAAVLVGSFASEESADNTRANRAVSLFGIAVILLAFYLTSAARSRINWRTVIVGMLAQYVIGLFVLRIAVGYDIFKFIADRAGDLLGFSKDGVAFLTTPDVARTPWFFLGVIPAIIFISLVQVLYYIGFLQWFISKLATFVFWAMGASGAEAIVAAAATPFIGQGESAMLVRPFVPHMTRAEIHQVMTCGFATISGSVLVGYIGLGLNPETEETLTAGRVVIPDDDEHKAEKTRCTHLPTVPGSASASAPPSSPRCSASSPPSASSTASSPGGGATSTSTTPS